MKVYNVEDRGYVYEHGRVIGYVTPRRLSDAERAGRTGKTMTEAELHEGIARALVERDQLDRAIANMRCILEEG